MIFPLWQSIGSSTHALAEKCGEEYQELATHTGTLDPMAEGVIVILTGEDRLVKGSLNWRKTYQFSILWGVRTDSADRLGLITENKHSENFSQMLKIISSACKNFPIHYSQIVPAFSARRINGKSSFELAKSSVKIPEKRRYVTVKSLSLIESKIIPSSTLIAEHSAAVKKVQGNFRQAEVLKSWTTSIFKSDISFLITVHTVSVSSGTYIRQLVTDLAEKIGMPATTWSIIRTKNGPYEKEDCGC